MQRCRWLFGDMALVSLLHYSVTCIGWLGVEDACKSTAHTFWMPKVG